MARRCAVRIMRWAVGAMLLMGPVCGGLHAKQDKLALPQVTPSQQFTMQLTLLLYPESHCVMEPVVAKVTVATTQQDVVTVTTTNRFHFVVQRPSGELDAPPLPPEDAFWGLAGAARLSPEIPSYPSYFVLNQQFRLEQPGAYEVRCYHFSDGPTMADAQASATLRITPLDPDLLERRLESFYRMHGASRWPELIEEQVPRDLRMPVRDAIWSVRHEVALPYMDRIAREWPSVEACLAIRRVGGPRAQRILDWYMSRTDELGEAARKALAMPLGASQPLRADG